MRVPFTDVAGITDHTVISRMHRHHYYTSVTHCGVNTAASFLAVGIEKKVQWQGTVVKTTIREHFSKPEFNPHGKVYWLQSSQTTSVDTTLGNGQIHNFYYYLIIKLLPALAITLHMGSIRRCLH